MLLQFGTLFTRIVLRRWRPDDRLTHVTECYWSSIPRHAYIYFFLLKIGFLFYAVSGDWSAVKERTVLYSVGMECCSLR